MQVPQLLGADGFLFCAPENLATMSGEMCLAWFFVCYVRHEGPETVPCRLVQGLSEFQPEVDMLVFYRDLPVL